MAQNLFSLSGIQQGQGAKPLVEYKCGKMNNGTNQQLVAEKRKGILQVLQSPDGLMHVVWKDRTTGSTEDDLIIFPGEATFKKLKQVENGRVFLLEFPATSRRLFFWSQESATDKDDETVSKVNQLLNNPPVPENQEYSFSHSINQPNQSTKPDTSPINSPPTPINSNPPPQPQPKSETPSSTTAPSSNQSTSSTGTTQPNNTSTAFNSGDLQLQLQNILASFNGLRSPEPDVSLNDVIDPDMILGTLSEPSVQQQLIPFLPDGHQSTNELMMTMRSPQVQQALSVFTRAIQSGELNDMMRELGINQFVSTVRQFLQGLEDVSASEHGREKEAKRQKTESDSMETN